MSSFIFNFPQDFGQLLDTCHCDGPLGFHFRSISILLKHLDPQFIVFVNSRLCIHIQLYSTKSTTNTLSICYFLYDLLYRKHCVCYPLCDLFTRWRQTRRLFSYFVHSINRTIYCWYFLHDIILFVVSSEPRQPTHISSSRIENHFDNCRTRYISIASISLSTTTIRIKCNEC